MATTATSITITAKNFPYIGPHQSYGMLPSAEILFVDDTDIIVAASGRDQLLDITMNLPKGWAYVMVEGNIEIAGADAADWDDCLRCQVRDIQPAGSFTFSANLTLCNIPGETWSSDTSIKGKTYQVVDVLKKVIICDGAVDGRVFVHGMNRVVDGAAGFTETFFRFLRFSLEQAHHFAISTPIPVR